MIVLRSVSQPKNKLRRRLLHVKRHVLAHKIPLPYKEIGHRIADLRREVGRKRGAALTQKEAAAGIRVGKSTWIAWETGRQRPDAANLLSLANYFSEQLERDVPPDYIIHGTEDGGRAEAESHHAEEAFLSLDATTRFLAGIAPAGQAKELKLDALEAYRRMITARTAVPLWWPELKKKIEDGEL